MTRNSFRVLWLLRNLVAGALLITGVSSGIAVEAVGILNDTGQVACYGAVDYANPYNAVPCDEATTGDDSPFPGQDGRYGRDAAAAMGRLPKIGGGEAGFDFTRVCMSGEDEGHGDCASPPPLPADLEYPEPNDWACLRDNVSGLTFTLGNPEQVTWATASNTAEGSYIERANSSSRCGLDSGWRLPHRREGWSLLNINGIVPQVVDPAYFPVLATKTLQDGMITVWSADPTAWHGMFQWTISFGSASTGMQCRELALPIPCNTYPAGVTEWTSGILLVNGVWRQPNGKPGQDSERWQIRDDGLIVTDTATGLVWDRCGWGQTDPACEGDVTIFPNWVDAMQVARVANEQRWKGFHDWRVPNMHELESLVKMDAYPAFDTGVFPNTLAVDSHSLYWTSTQTQWLPGWSPEAVAVNFFLGVMAGADKVYSLPPGMYPHVAAVRLVRGGSGWDSFDGVSGRLFWDDFDGASSTASVH